MLTLYYVLIAVAITILAILIFVLLEIRTTRKQITAYLDSLGDMTGDLLRELIEAQGTAPKTNDKIKGKGKQ